MAEEDDFLSRWSRRKRAVTKEKSDPRLDPESQADAEVPEQVQNSEAPEEDEATLLERLNLPVPETLTEGDDFSAFMKAGVPEFLRKRALRVLWRSNPVLANLDGLNDYDEDFTAPELTQKVLATGYQVGRGFVKKVLEPEESEAEVSVEEVSNTENEDVTPEAEPAETNEVLAEEDTVAEAEEVPIYRPRRMRFET